MYNATDLSVSVGSVGFDDESDSLRTVWRPTRFG
jgi:hypothetical protein